ncbi:hypothetical protein AB1Y20_017072 [Prymnesium parvum]|uniref:Sugar phosphate transporter domain-containing protein n=1 Tax=Prymnesium parvum TaxID=97485 RepID=A0AB34IBA1_PRYPA
MELEGNNLLEPRLTSEARPPQWLQALSRSPTCRALRLVGYICLWYALSVGLTLYNKWLFAVFGFHFPLLTTAYHFTLKLLLARLGMWLLRVSVLPMRRSLLTMWCRIAPTGVTTALDVAFSNLALLYITVTYYTIVKSSVPLWILAFSVYLGLQRLRWQMLLVLTAIGAGIVLATADADALPAHANGTADEAASGAAAAAPPATPAARAFGLLLVLGASFCAGFRWACTQLLLQSLTHARGAASPEASERAALHPLSLVYAFSPFACAVLLPFAAWVEMADLRVYLSELEAGALLPVAGLASAGALLGFLLILAELRVVQLSSGLSLSVAGILKELLTVLASALVLGDQLTTYNVLGLAMCLFGILVYTCLMQADAIEARSKAFREKASLPKMCGKRKDGCTRTRASACMQDEDSDMGT